MVRALRTETRAVVAGITADALRACALVAFVITAALGVIHADRTVGPVETISGAVTFAAIVLAIPARWLEERWEVEAYRHRLAAASYSHAGRSS